MKSRSKKDKGKRLQNWVCQKLSELLGVPWGKDELIASREMGQTGVDIRLIGEAKKRFSFAVECKNQETWKLPNFIRQAKDNQGSYPDWLLVLKKNHFEPIVVMDAEAFFKLMKKVIKKEAKCSNT